MVTQGTLAITARGDGNRWYGRISISAEIAAEALLREGSRVSARCVDGIIIIQADENGRIKFPGARGKSEPRHAFEAATSTLGLKEVRLPQALATAEVADGQIRITVPRDCLAEDDKRRRKAKKTPTRALPEPIKDEPKKSPQDQKLWGTAAAIVTEANRAGKQVAPKSLAEIVTMIRDKGITVEINGPRFFRVGGKSATIPDLLDEVNKLYGSTEQNRIALIMD